MGLPGYVSTAFNAVNGTTSLTVNVPSGTINGHVMIAHGTSGASGTFTAPAGWTQIDANATGWQGRNWYRVASSEPASYNWTQSVSSLIVVSIYTFRGVDNISPINAHAQAVSTTAATVTGPTITTTVPGCLIVYLRQSRSSGSTNPAHSTSDTGVTAIDDVGANGNSQAGWYSKNYKDKGSVTGISTTATQTLTNCDHYTVALTPDPSLLMAGARQAPPWRTSTW